MAHHDANDAIDHNSVLPIEQEIVHSVDVDDSTFVHFLRRNPLAAVVENGMCRRNCEATGEMYHGRAATLNAHGDDTLHLSSLAASIATDSVALSEISHQFVPSIGHPHYTISPETPVNPNTSTTRTS